jgi:hypothetical protein
VQLKSDVDMLRQISRLADMEFKINTDIPGQMTRKELSAVSYLASTVPDRGIIVESGSLFGLSSWHWSNNSTPGCQVFCIDPWERVKWIVDLVEKPQGTRPFSRAAFEEYTADCKNIIAIQGYSPSVLRNWNLPIDIYFDDAMHQNPVLRENLQFWSKFIVPGGYVCGHDYCQEWPDVIHEANLIAQRWNTKVHVVETVWWVQRPARV